MVIGAVKTVALNTGGSGDLGKKTKNLLYFSILSCICDKNKIGM